MHGIIGLGTGCFDGSKGASYHVCSERLLDVRLGRGGEGRDANLIPHKYTYQQDESSTLHVYPYDLQQVELPGQCSWSHWQWDY